MLFFAFYLKGEIDNKGKVKYMTYDATILPSCLAVLFCLCRKIFIFCTYVNDLGL